MEEPNTMTLPRGQGKTPRGIYSYMSGKRRGINEKLFPWGGGYRARRGRRS